MNKIETESGKRRCERFVLRRKNMEEIDSVASITALRVGDMAILVLFTFAALKLTLQP